MDETKALEDQDAQNASQDRLIVRLAQTAPTVLLSTIQYPRGTSIILRRGGVTLTERSLTPEERRNHLQ
ncbi:hypothetical protein TNCV_2564301 [Trichonephila clavipes]|nr:hypothetical protein TNCV_2564301 [Trichonephila clavipes]